jgi:hypothetical protein
LLIIGSSWTYTIVGFFRRFGAPGLFFLGAPDSSFLVLPFGNDFLLIALVRSSRGLVWIVYVMVSALGSLLCVFIVDSIMRKAGETGCAAINKRTSGRDSGSAGKRKVIQLNGKQVSQKENNPSPFVSQVRRRVFILSNQASGCVHP